MLSEENEMIARGNCVRLDTRTNYDYTIDSFVDVESDLSGVGSYFWIGEHSMQLGIRLEGL